MRAAADSLRSTRLAPEHPFPAAVEDSYFASAWVWQHARQLSIDPTRIAVAGDSAGGTLAAVVCQRAKHAGGPSLALQVLFCPVTDLSQYPSRGRPMGSNSLERKTLDWAISQYCPADTDLADCRISPLRALDLAGLPPAHIHTAEFDPVRDEGKAYAVALARAGVPVRYVCHAGMIHHFYCMGGAISYAQAAIAQAERHRGARQPESQQMQCPGGKELDIGGDATIPDFDEIDKFSHYRRTGYPRVDLRAPVHGCLRAIDKHCEDRLLTKLERLDHDREQRTKFADADCAHRDWTRIAAGPATWKLASSARTTPHTAARSPRTLCIIQREQQAFGLEPLRHWAISS